VRYFPPNSDVILWSAAPRPRPRFALLPRPRGGRGSNGDSPREGGDEPPLRGTVDHSGIREEVRTDILSEFWQVAGLRSRFPSGRRYRSMGSPFWRFRDRHQWAGRTRTFDPLSCCTLWVPRSNCRHRPEMSRVSIGISGLLQVARDVPNVWLIPPRTSTVGTSLRESTSSEDILARFPGAAAPSTEELRFLRSVGLGRRGPVALCGADRHHTQVLAPRRAPVFF